jgi:hypothetical protein
VNGARKNDVTLSFEIRRLSLWLAVPMRITSPAPMCSGSFRPERRATRIDPAKPALKIPANRAYDASGGRSCGAA